ncbi:hypothetical protein [Methylocystis sp.]|uniref:hypothetical protein n=1 Tax=Methylocystis sp. TaxID=1911079 RepID=UPI0025D4CCD2|nr:hypothetical protein [Methylocystis sp.]
MNHEEYPIDERGIAPPDEAASYIHSTKATLAVWRHQGKGPRFIKRGARVFYSYAELDRHHRALKIFSSTAEYVGGAAAYHHLTLQPPRDRKPKVAKPVNSTDTRSRAERIVGVGDADLDDAVGV